MIWTGLLILDSSAKGGLSFMFAGGVFIGVYVWSAITIIVLIYSILLVLIGTNLSKQLLRLIMLCMGATVVPLVLNAIISFFLDSLVDATPYENGGKQYPEIVAWIFFLAPSASVFIGLALGRWLYHRIEKS